MPVSQIEPDVKSKNVPQYTKKIIPGYKTLKSLQSTKRQELLQDDQVRVSFPYYQQPVFYNSYLRPNAKFSGFQRSGKSKFDIQIEFKTIDLQNSLVLGFLKINGLTDLYPEITTCFRGEIINNPLIPTVTNIKRYSFLTENKQWASNLRNDLEHWKKLTNNYNLTDDEFLKDLQLINYGVKHKGLVYMRWKEEFLLPDARVKQLKGASFEGFYYIVLNIGSQNDTIPFGTVNGLYYHKSSEKFQSLSLRAVDTKGMEEVFNFV